MIIVEDKAQKVGKHEIKNDYFHDNDIEIWRYPLPVGDYILGTDKVVDVIERKHKRGIEPGKMDFLGTYDRVIDSKFSVEELYGDMVGSHERFRDEMILAKNNGIKLIILVENKEGIKDLAGLAKWQNPRRERWYRIWNAKKQGKARNVNIPKQPPMSSESLAKALTTASEKYGTEFIFCLPEEAGAKIVEILTNDTGTI